MTPVFLRSSWAFNLNTTRHVFQFTQIRSSHLFNQSEEVAESVPKNLYLTAAILIREEFITLEDLYPHFSGILDWASQFFSCTLLIRIWKNTSPTFSLVLLAPRIPSCHGRSFGVCSLVFSEIQNDFPFPKSRKKADVKDTNQKAGLLVSLLAVGALSPLLLSLPSSLAG